MKEMRIKSILGILLIAITGVSFSLYSVAESIVSSPPEFVIGMIAVAERTPAIISSLEASEAMALLLALAAITFLTLRTTMPTRRMARVYNLFDKLFSQVSKALEHGWRHSYTH